MDAATRTVLFSSVSDEYQTPPEIWTPLNDALHFTLDAAAGHDNHRTPAYYTSDGLYIQNFTVPNKVSRLAGEPLPEGINGLTGPWNISAPRGIMRQYTPARVWLNPPFSLLEEFMRKCVMERNNCEYIAALLPARTDTEWFHRWVAPYAELHFLMGRVRFIGHSAKCAGEAPHAPHRLAGAPFPSMVAIYSPEISVPRGVVLGYSWDAKTSAFELGAGRG